MAAPALSFFVSTEEPNTFEAGSLTDPEVVEDGSDASQTAAARSQKVLTKFLEVMGQSLDEKKNERCWMEYRAAMQTVSRISKILNPRRSQRSDEKKEELKTFLSKMLEGVGNANSLQDVKNLFQKMDLGSKSGKSK
ncbi:hypothetical protein CAEBREN_08547 [Caenorhabditis brenneri]|uniref:Uncharacterized protein n=1 Tax=Caenorhabditis brenneri TaxID=135651 RepID=G0P871_CAEBE|nr:hypothetical protein CAEBREN_08547 [Caenorhabditis brenneri]